MKKWAFLLSVVAVMLFLASNAASALTVTPKLVLDGNVLKPAAAPALIGSYTMVPIRIVTENLGYKVDYDNDKKQITIRDSSQTVTMVVGKTDVAVNGQSAAMQTSPVIRSSTTLVPLRFVGETFGLQVYWDNDGKSAFLYSAGNSSGGSTGGSTAPGTGSGGTNAGGSNGNGQASDGSDDDSVPPEGGLIGIVPPEQTPEDGTSGGSDSGSLPDGSQGKLTQIRGVTFTDDTVVIKYDSGLLLPATSVLTGPDRIVVDLPSAAFASDFAPELPLNADGTLKQIGQLVVDGDEALQDVRYSLYDDSTHTLRFVLDLSQKQGYALTNDPSAGELRIALQPPGSSQPPAGGGKYTVVLDAGHGGTDPGAPSISGRWEKDFTLSVILKLQAILAADPRLNVVLTRSGDTYPTLADRYNLANSLNADLFLSVHGNSNTKNTVKGTEVYYTRAESLDFAKAVHEYAVPAGGLQDRGILQQSLAVTRETKMPAVLYEAGYLSNASDEKTMYTDDFQNRLAQGLATAILKYLQLA